MNQETHNDLIATFNEVEETHTSLVTLTDEELIECREALITRMESALYWLGKYVSDEDVIKELK